MSIITKFKGFLGHYADEVATISTALSMLLTNLPIPRAEKESILEAVFELEKVGARIEKGIKGLTDGAGLTAADRKAIAKEVAELLRPDLEKLIADQAIAASLDAVTKLLETPGTEKTGETA